MQDFREYQLAFAAHIRDPKGNPRPTGVASARMRVYTEIVFNNLLSSVTACFPVCRQMLGKRQWERLVRGFFASYPANSPMFRDIPKLFLDYLQTLDHLPGFLPALAHYEWMELAISVVEWVPDLTEIDPAGDLLEGMPVLVPAFALLTYDYPVHLISPRFKPNQKLAAPVHLLIFRKLDDSISFMELNTMTAALLESLQQGGQTGSEALLALAGAAGHPQPEAVLQFGADILAALRAQGAIMGTRKTG